MYLALESGLPRFLPGSTCPEVLRNRVDSTRSGFYLQGYHLLWRAAPGPSTIRTHETSFRCKAQTRPYNFPAATHIGYHTAGIWAVALSLAATRAISVDFFFLRVLRCFTSPRIASGTYVFSAGFRQISDGGFPHSDISGSMPACGFPELIAACHVLHRWSKPRHPPTALRSLTTRELLEIGRAHV